MNDARLYLHTSNRMEELAGMLARLLEEKNSDPFQEETVLVQSRGMGRWLSLQLSDALGICMNVRFPFPREIVEEILQAMLPDWQGVSAFRRETMVWRIFRLIAELSEEPAFAPIANYLEKEDHLKRLQLADRIGGLFDKYLMYRPDWLISWEEREDAEKWQAILWRRLVEESGDEFHFGRAWQALISPDRRFLVSGKLPPRICVFGISSLPPFFLQVMQSYAQSGEIHMFLLQPTDKYWGDLVSKKQQARLAGIKPDVSLLEAGHPLVASLGKQGQDLLNLLIDYNFQTSDDREAFRGTGGETILNRLQDDILLLSDREQTDAEKIAVDVSDSSIQVHSCHSPMREVEVLRDQLLDLFQKYPSLRPRDILVMIPDIESYAPYIQAVFGCACDGLAKIPFSVVDRSQRSSHHAIDAWFQLLELSGSRFRVRDVVSLLESTPFQMRFGFNERDANCLRSWIQATGIRWGIDAAHREEEGLPAINETTWDGGIEQWLLGFAMREDQGEAMASFNRIFPFDEIEGGNIALLDLFLRLLDFLFNARNRLAGRRTLEAWCDCLSGLHEDLFGEVDELSLEAAKIRASLQELRKAAESAGTSEPVSLEAVRYFIERAVDDTLSTGGFLSGGVTFCALQPMRTIPARVVCLLGMNDGSFPRRTQELGFDMMREDRRLGDRSVREDDRSLFLETLLSARETLILSHVGQSAHDLSDSPPSVLVSELIDHLDRVCCFPDGSSAREFIVRRHRLQPFHPDYFSGGRLFSYSHENAAACQRLIGGREDLPHFSAVRLGEPDPELRTVAIGQLVRFLRNPSEFFIRERIGLRMPREEPMLEDSEMFDVDSLTEYGIRKEAVDALMGKAATTGWERLQARGRAPLGVTGRAICHGIQKDAQRFVARLSGRTGGSGADGNREIDLRMGDFHLRGEIGPFYDGRLVLYRPARLNARDRVAGWVQHLAACCSAKAGEASTTLLAGSNCAVELPPEPDSARLLEALLKLYWRGLAEPLPFFAEAAWTYLAVLARKGRDAALDAAWKKFAVTTDYSRSELDDPYVSLCWGGVRAVEAIGANFEQTSETVFSAFGVLSQEVEL